MTSPGVTLNAVKSGNSVDLTLNNGSASAIGYNLCSSALMRRTGNTWTSVATNQMCTMELRTLPPGESAHFRHTLPSGIAQGDYRYETGAETPLNGERTGVISNSFSVP